MLSHYPARFEREQGFSATDWLACLNGAVRGRAWRLVAEGCAQIDLDGGRLTLSWQALAPRRFALVALPRLAVTYKFDASISAAARLEFMTYFDLYTLRGGG
jgi:hypothetical protein